MADKTDSYLYSPVIYIIISGGEVLKRDATNAFTKLTE